MTDWQALSVRIRKSLYPLEALPAGEPWNLDELDGLLPETENLTPAAVVVGLVPRPSGTTVVLTMRNADLRQHAGQVSFPGGRIEPQDNGPAEAAIRETEEETAIRSDQVIPWGWLDPLATITGFRVFPLVAELSVEIEPLANPDEVDTVFEVPLDHLLRPENLVHTDIEYRGRKRRVLEYAPFDEGSARIWGATAAILQNMMQRVASVPAHAAD